MRFLLDTNILIPLEDSTIKLKDSLAHFISLATKNKHELLYHPASKKDIERDSNTSRRQQTLTRISSRYQCLENPPLCPWNTLETNENDAVDNEILYAIKQDAAHALVTEDRDIHIKAKNFGLEKRILDIQAAKNWLESLHEQQYVPLPNIQEINLYELDTNHSFFDSLRTEYLGFDKWLSDAAQNGRKAWMYGNNVKSPEALCIYTVQNDHQITGNKQILKGSGLKLCTFKVAEPVRGRKIGELFLKAAFRYATDKKIEYIFITVQASKQQYLVDLLEDFGFKEDGIHKGDTVYIKAHPTKQPPFEDFPFEYNRKYFPHYQDSAAIQKFIIPINPTYHEMLFPDYRFSNQQLKLFASDCDAGNAIKLAYICHTPLKQMKSGDIVIFYRSTDLKAITSLGIVEGFSVTKNIEEIASLVRGRTVYNMEEIQRIAEKQTKVILFRLVKHFTVPISFAWLKSNGVVNGNIQTIRKIENEEYNRISNYVS